MSDQPGEAGPQKKNGNGQSEWEKEFAEEVPPPPDPLEDLIAKVKAKLADVYTPEAAAVMAAIYVANPGEYLAACAALKAANPLFSKQEMDKLVRRELATSMDLGVPDINAAEMLLKLAEDIPLFVNQDREPFADVVINGARHTCHVRGSDLAEELIDRYYDATKRAPPREAIAAATDTLAAKAKRGPKLLVFPRVGHADGRIYVDRGTDDRSLIEIDASGRRLVHDSPIRFIRPSHGMGELPIPEPGGSIEELRQFLNLRGEVEFILAVGWILSCFMTKGAYPIAWLLGPHGVGKTFAQRRMGDLVDPLLDEPWSPFKDEQSAVVAAQRTLVQPYDNTVHISPEHAAVYCRMSTGGALRARKLYTDGDEFVMHAKRPVSMNSTRAVVTAEDLADRMLLLGMKMEFSSETPRKSEEQLALEFTAAQPRLFGVICDAVSAGLRHQDDPVPENLPRMSDFAVWCSRCETGLGWAPGTFLNAYRENIRERARVTAELDLVASAVVGFMETHDTWSGPASELLQNLRVLVGERATFRKEWPQSPNWLSHRLAELRPLLAHNDIGVESRRGSNSGPRSISLARLSEMTQPEAPAAQPDTPSVAQGTGRRREEW